MENKVQRYSLIIVGEPSIGKTSLVRCYSGMQFNESYMVTLGIDYTAKVVKPEGHTQEINVKIWDTAGQERFRSLTQSYYRQA